jgi:hypothetical protein
VLLAIAVLRFSCIGAANLPSPAEFGFSSAGVGLSVGVRRYERHKALRPLGLTPFSIVALFEILLHCSQ